MKNTFTLLISLLVFSHLQAQLFFDTSYTAETMVMDFFDGSCVSVNNVTYTGADLSMAYFEGASTNIGVNAGILLSTGNILGASGPNDESGISTNWSEPGDPNLEADVGITTFDAAVLEFDFVATDSLLIFQYVFASEEYPEFVNTGFNDIFAFYVSGPGINGWQNVALIPGTTIPVSIDNVNTGSYSNYYIDNLNGQTIQYDGFTTSFLAPFSAIPNETYTAKIAIADAGDASYDSSVFLGIESLCGDSLLVPPTQFAHEIMDKTVTFQNDSRYATSWLWDFGDGNSSNLRYPSPHTYADDGIYDVTLTTENYCCTNTHTETLNIGNVSANNDLASLSISIHPNPVKDFLWIEKADEKGLNLSFYDLTGRLLFNKTIQSSTRLDLSAYETGSYILKFTSAETVVSRRLLLL